MWVGAVVDGQVELRLQDVMHHLLRGAVGTAPLERGVDARVDEMQEELGLATHEDAASEGGAGAGELAVYLGDQEGGKARERAVRFPVEVVDRRDALGKHDARPGAEGAVEQRDGAFEEVTGDLGAFDRAGDDVVGHGADCSGQGRVTGA